MPMFLTEMRAPAPSAFARPSHTPGASIPYAPSRRSVPDAAHLLLFATILVAGLVSLPQETSFGPVTGLGAASALGSAAAWLLWLARPTLSRRHVPTLALLLMFIAFAVGSLLWSPVGVKGLQLLCVLTGFVALVLLTTRAVEEDPALVARLHRTLDVATWFATVVYAYSLFKDGLGADSIILARPFALFVLLGFARQLAIWQSGDMRGLLGAAVIVAVLLGSISRTALVAAMVLFPLAAIVRGDAKGVAFAVGSIAAAALALAAAVTFNDTIHERFFGLDASMQVGGVAVNASGRTAMWSLLWDNAVTEPILGHGLASSSLLIDKYFPGLGHPHNDYLRFFHDFGVVGLGLWLAFYVYLGIVLFARARRAARARSADAPVHLVALLGLVGLGLTMATDNSVSYVFVMAPLAVMIGCSLGRSTPAGERQA
jgi:O-antigen ligase